MSDKGEISSAPFYAHRALLLNADFRPMGFPVQTLEGEELVQRLLAGTVVPVKMSTVVARSQKMEIVLPSVVALKHFSTALTPDSTPPCTLRNLYERENGRCGYQRKRKVSMSGRTPADKASIDHLTPACMGGEITWDNVALAAQDTNSRRGHDNRVDKGGRYDRRLQVLVYAPTHGNLIAFHHARVGYPEDWREFMEPLTPRHGPAAEMWQEHRRMDEGRAA